MIFDLLHPVIFKAIVNQVVATAWVLFSFVFDYKIQQLF